MTETREILLDLGEAAVRSRGYAGFSYADLARDAGIRKASIHHHFPAKADLARELVNRYDAKLIDAFAAIRDSSPTAGAALGRAVELYRDALGDGSRMCLCAAMATDAALLDDATLQALNAANAAARRWFAEIFRAGQSDGSITGVSEPESEAQAALALLQGAQLIARAAVAPERFDEATVMLRARIGG